MEGTAVAPPQQHRAGTDQSLKTPRLGDPWGGQILAPTQGTCCLQPEQAPAAQGRGYSDQSWGHFSAGLEASHFPKNTARWRSEMVLVGTTSPQKTSLKRSLF